MKVLITGCGRHSKEIIDNLKNNEDGVEVSVIGVNNNSNNLLRDGLDNSYIVPSFNDENYIPALLDICQKEEVDVIFPYITAELPLMAENRGLFKKAGVEVSIASSDSIRIANDKIELQKHFGHYMPQQKVATSIEEIDEFSKEMDQQGKKFCCKLSDRAGGTGFAIVDDMKAKDIGLWNKVGVNRFITLNALKETVAEKDFYLILQEYTEGLDYSVVAMIDDGIVQQKCGYVGYQMEFGAVVSGAILSNYEAYRMVDELSDKLNLHGNACFDFILKPNGEVVLLEINPRINATLPFVTEAGINIPYLTCKMLKGDYIPKEYYVNEQLKISKYYISKYYE